jgi:hypothetical protein
METNFENVFNWIFNSLEILSKNWNANYKKVSNNALYKNNQIIYSIDFSNYKLSWIKYEILIYNNLLNEININSKNILIKNIIQNNAWLIETYKEIYNEIEHIDVDCRLNNNKFEIYTTCSDETK